VTVGKGEAGSLEVIEARVCPASRRMAVLTHLAVPSRMRVVDTMAGDTGHGCVEVCLVAMTAAAGCADVVTGQRKISRVVVELGVCPTSFAMTIAAALAEISVVGVFGAVAGEAGRFCLPEGHICSVAGFALRALMAPEQREVGHRVIEGIAIQADDIGVSAFVLGMAARTFELWNCR
jgi:hypothetical protein